MKEQIYTIPVIDGFKEKKECPFCSMYKKLEDDAVDYMLGPSYMEDDIREETDKAGFCKNHYKKMYEKQNRLGIALMIHTHLKKINATISDFSINEGKKRVSLFSNKTEENPFCNYFDKVGESCYICEKIENTFKRYVDTFFYMWKKETEIKQLVSESKGFCIKHFSMLLKEGEQKLNDRAYKEFTDIIIPLQKESLKALEADVEWFINKFDYKYQNEPWKNAKDSLPRAITKLSSYILEE